MPQNKNFFPSKYPHAVPQEILDRRADQSDARDDRRNKARFLLGTAVAMAALSVIGVETVIQNRAHAHTQAKTEQLHHQ